MRLPPQPEASGSLPALHPGGRILVVDDSVVIRRLLHRTLTLFGYTVVEAIDGQDALALLESTPGFDLLITDLQMPRMDGYTLIQRIRTSEAIPQIPIVVLTGEDMDTSAGPPCGAQLLLTKPFAPTQLLSTVRDMIPRDRK